MSPGDRLTARCHRVAGWAAAAMIVLGGAAPAAASLRRVEGAWLLPPALQAPLLRESGRVGEPAGAWLRIGHARLYGLPELPARLLAVGAAGRAWAAEARWESLGSETLRDDRAEAGFRVGGAWQLGLRAGRRTLRLGAGETAAALDVDVEIARYGRSEPIGSWLVQANWPLLRDSEPWLAAEPEARLRAALAGSGRALAVVVESAADGEQILGWEVLAALGGGLAVSWRSDPASGAAGAGLLWRKRGLRLRTSHLAHPELGLTHRVELCLGNPGRAPW